MHAVRVDGKAVEDHHSETFCIGDGDVCHALELAVPLMCATPAPPHPPRPAPRCRAQPLHDHCTRPGALQCAMLAVAPVCVLEEPHARSHTATCFAVH